ncbi:uncharacterized protein BJ171DRAFT_585198 [Polychytrium aggregatum]|uniref:uncharacterized protein n=1 Tax=Polychytrium aggregatum TaxID=110093 RepID=UPI0022FDDBE8|nr:uncharacterized protein BJ171DRAFT_585198 [Polychytrium aggregatum]KAI9199649.1 hypothetical protein BJ171DRAFT_585198 [Polychytrium aggregatum]
MSILIPSGAAGQQAKLILDGAGPDPPFSLFQQLASIYSVYDPLWDYSYSDVGTGAGRAALIASNSNLTWASSDYVPSNVSYTGPGNTLGNFVPVPAIMSCIAIVYHLNVTNLTLTRQNLADIFSGKIAYWNDPRLVQNNPALTTITARVQTIVNAGTVGMTVNFLYALNRIDPSLNLSYPSSYPLPTWGPANPPLYGKDNTVMSDGIQVTPNSIGYIAFPFANLTLASLLPSGFNLYAFASIINKNGDIVQPSVTGMSAALSVPVASNMSALRHLSSDIGNAIQSAYIDSATPNAYPFMEPTLFMLRQDSQLYGLTAPEIQATLRFLFWIIFGGTETVAPAEPVMQPSASTYFHRYNFIHFRDINIRQFVYDALKLVTHNGQPLFDPASPCNPVFDTNLTYISSNSCKHGYCIVDGPFQSSSQVQCICNVGYYNNLRLDCSEPASPFMLLFGGIDSYNIVVIAFLAIAVLINIGIWILIFLWRKKPDVQAISPSCCHVIMMGALIGQVAALFFSANPSPLVCGGRILLPVIAFSSVFSMLLMKSIRIYIIFGYKRIRTIKTPDWKLILATGIIVVLEVIYCAVWIGIDYPTPSIEGSVYAMVCSTEKGSITTPSILLYLLNGFILIGCVVFAYLTRGAHERFQESKVIGMCSYFVSMTMLLCLPMIYALSDQVNSQDLFSLGQVMMSCLVIVVSSLVPVILFAARLIRTFKSRNDAPDSEKQTQKSSPTTTNRSAITSQGMTKAAIVAYAYDCGLQGLKFGGAWVSSTVLVLTTLDLIEFREADVHGSIQASFRFSSCECELCDPNSDPNADKILARSVKLRQGKVTYTLEFGAKETAFTFLENYAEAKAKTGGTLGRGVGGIGGVGGALRRDSSIYGMLSKLDPEPDKSTNLKDQKATSTETV